MPKAAGMPWLGFDEHGEVRDLGHVVHRRIRDDYKSAVASLHRTYRQENLAGKGIVETELLDDGDLEHRKLVTSYPYEWPANMYKQAVLFHLELFLELEKAGLTLKDALPNNIVFDATTPVFVDFLSLVPIGQLKEVSWLFAERYADARFAVVDRMLMPYLVLPVLFLARREFGIARDLLSWRSCNCDGKPPSWAELLRPNRRPGLGWIRDYLKSLHAALQLLPLRARNRGKAGAQFSPLLQAVSRRVQELEVTPPPSAYSSYYDEKKEALALEDTSGFPPKQRAVHEILLARQPATVLDIGANTGWYSRLAAMHGASVIALEEDEACVDIVYRQARRDSTRILPLKLAFGDLTTEIQGSRAQARAFDYSKLGPQALYRAGVDRLGADLVLVLGLLHHLILGEGRSLDDVFGILHRLATRTLVVEFVGLEDAKVRDEPDFFPNLRKFDASVYNVDAVVRAARKHFARVEVLPSHPATRCILVFDR
jgi:hypothetical protein